MAISKRIEKVYMEIHKLDFKGHISMISLVDCFEGFPNFLLFPSKTLLKFKTLYTYIFNFCISYFVKFGIKGMPFLVHMVFIKSILCFCIIIYISYPHVKNCMTNRNGRKTVSVLKYHSFQISMSHLYSVESNIFFFKNKKINRSFVNICTVRSRCRRFSYNFEKLWHLLL